MSSFSLNREALSIGIVAVVVAGRGGPQLPIGAPDAMPAIAQRPLARVAYHVLHRFGTGTDGSSKTGAEKVLHNFGNKPGDAASPWAPLVSVGGFLYGTTAGGGTPGADGTAFRMTMSGVTKELHSFCTGTDGCGPVAGLIDVNGTLYGTTPRGGRYGVAHNGNDGTVFSITTKGNERTLHNFGNGYDGFSPKA